MLLRITSLVVLLGASLSLNASAGRAVQIAHSVDGTLGSGSTPAAVNAILVHARWSYNNPDKERSTWESMWLEFDATGNVDVTTMNAWGPSVG